MRRTFSLCVLLLAIGVAQVIPQTPQTPVAPAAQPAGFGTIQGIVVRDGTTDPIPEVQITITGRGGLTTQEAQSILNASSRGAGGLPPEILQIAQEAARGGATQLTAVSDSSGQFTIRNVAAGMQTLRAQLEGYFGKATNGQYPSQVNMPVTISADKTSNVRITMLPGGTISGRVFDPLGKPLSDAPVQVLQMGYENGALTPQLSNLKQTDDRGEYRMYRLPPGDYLLAASPRPQALLGARGNAGPNPQEVQIPTYYPSAPDPADSTRIALHSGDDLTGVNIQMRTAVGAKVSGRVTSAVPPGPTAGPRGQTRTGGVMLVQTDSRGLISLDDLGAGGTISLGADGGTFEFQNVAPGMYDVVARISTAAGNGWGPQAPPATATGPWAVGKTSIEVRSANVDNVAIAVRTGVDLKGRVLLDGTPARANVRVTVQPDNSMQGLNDGQLSAMFNQIRQYSAPIADDGSFAIPLLPEGRYRVQVQLNAPATAARGARGAAAAPAVPDAPPPPQLPSGSYLADIRQGAVSVYDNGLVVGTDPLNPIDVLVNTSGGAIDGTVSGADQKPAADMTVVLVPAENRRQNPALYKTSRSDAQGRFRMASIPPGRYTLYAWESVPNGAWQNVEFMAKYTGRGTGVIVDAGGRATVSINAIRETSSGR